MHKLYFDEHTLKDSNVIIIIITIIIMIVMVMIIGGESYIYIGERDSFVVQPRCVYICMMYMRDELFAIVAN